MSESKASRLLFQRYQITQKSPEVEVFTTILLCVVLTSWHLKFTKINKSDQVKSKTHGMEAFNGSGHFTIIVM